MYLLHIYTWIEVVEIQTFVGRKFRNKVTFLLKSIHNASNRSLPKPGFKIRIYGVVSTDRFVLRMPLNLPLDASAPLLCAGITVWSPMKYFGMVEQGKYLGLVGLGGLGHMAIKFAKAFGMKVTVFSTSPAKEKEAREILGADNFIITKDNEKMKVKELPQFFKCF
jgi:threonine dehydrogenase-like Zn-dependent dehydrogenase